VGQDAAAGGIGQGGEGAVERTGILNHLVNYQTEIEERN
jgi:hypothetical protein